ncbi:MAG: cytidylate kinase [Thermoprotei archaeon]|nr:MAG: cytidylate kinase [Thermoprotei archaeon]RLF24291.1 MAG: cytidylate kinase [Thermoprotei archaeon]
MKKLVIAVSGPPASGKSTIARFLAKEFGLRYVSAGNLFRRLAQELNISLEEFHRLAEKDKKYDLMVDQRTIEEAKKGDVVLDGHLTGWIARDHADLKIYLTAPLEERAKRLAIRDGKSIEESMREILRREESNRKRYLEFYGIDIRDLSAFDVIIDTSKFSVESVKRIVKTIVEEYIESQRKM